MGRGGACPRSVRSVGLRAETLGEPDPVFQGLAGPPEAPAGGPSTALELASLRPAPSRGESGASGPGFPLGASRVLTCVRTCVRGIRAGSRGFLRTLG